MGVSIPNFSRFNSLAVMYTHCDYHNRHHLKEQYRNWNAERVANRTSINLTSNYSNMIIGHGGPRKGLSFLLCIF